MATNAEITRWAYDPKRQKLIEDLAREIGPFDMSMLRTYDDVGKFGLGKLMPDGEAPRNPGDCLDAHLLGRRQARDRGVGVREDVMMGGRGVGVKNSTMDSADDFIGRYLRL